MADMRRIPITINGEHTHPVGYLFLADSITDEMVIDTNVSWCYDRTQGKLLEAALIPHPKMPGT